MTVSAWAGSSNLGDELILAALIQRLRDRDHEPVVLSVDPAATESTHGVEAVAAHRPDALSALRHSDALVFGGGGLLQDRTSDLNLPYHLARLLAAPRTIPAVGVGLGAGPLDTHLGRTLVRRALPRLDAVAVRDPHSATVLRRLGLPHPRLAADLALGLEPPTAPPQGRLVVSLRPWTSTRRRLPVHLRRPQTPERVVDAVAAGVDAAAASTGLAVHFVALDPTRDHPLHEAVAARMRAPATLARPDVHTVLDELATGEVVVAMRYHAAIGAVLAGRPLVALSYDPKVAALTAELGTAARTIAWDDLALATELPEATAAVSGRHDQVTSSRRRLQARQRVNDEVLDLLDPARPPARRRSDPTG
ncbi:MAG: polysaccharide pyruvyl transferase family protein [Acidimicrobiales bacterium]